MMSEKEMPKKDMGKGHENSDMHKEMMNKMGKQMDEIDKMTKENMKKKSK